MDIWGYDHIFFNETYTEDYHLLAFKEIAWLLKKYTPKCVISFADIYRKNERYLKELSVKECDESRIISFSNKIKIFPLYVIYSSV